MPKSPGAGRDRPLRVGVNLSGCGKNVAQRPKLYCATARLFYSLAARRPRAPKFKSCHKLPKPYRNANFTQPLPWP